MKTLTEIDNELTINMEHLRQLFNKGSLIEICQFNLNNNLKSIPWDDLNYSGLYLIEIKNDHKSPSIENWLENFKYKWENEKHSIKSTPRIIKKRVKELKTLNEWIPIYIGKSKSISKRVNEHIYKLAIP